MERVTVLYTGRVQGVGFRAAVRGIARGYEVTGTVRNLPDGAVELVAEGLRHELRAFLDDIANGELTSNITTKPETWSQTQGGMRGFGIG